MVKKQKEKLRRHPPSAILIPERNLLFQGGEGRLRQIPIELAEEGLQHPVVLDKER